MNIFVRFVKIIFLLFVLFGSGTLYSHSSWEAHYQDIVEVLGLKKSENLKEWAKFISSDMIDKFDYHRELEKKFPNFRIGNPYYHRLLFHWGYNAEPWTSALEERFRQYCNEVSKQNNNSEELDNFTKSEIAKLKEELRNEQKRRNGLINNKTETTFGFAHGGRDASYARFFAAMAYNIHLLGDYTSDNTKLDGLQNLEALIGSVCTELRSFDGQLCKPIIAEITRINKRSQNSQKKADALMVYMKQSIPIFVKEAQGGSVYRRLKNKGFEFVV